LLTLRELALRRVVVAVRDGFFAVDLVAALAAAGDFAAVVDDFGFAADFDLAADFGFAAERFGLEAERDVEDEDLGAGMGARLSDQELQQRLLRVAAILRLIPDPLALPVEQSL